MSSDASSVQLLTSPVTSSAIQLMTPSQLSEFQDDVTNRSAEQLEAALPQLMLAALELLNSSDATAHEALISLLDPFYNTVNDRRSIDPRARLSATSIMPFPDYVSFLLSTIEEDADFGLPTWRLITNSSLVNALNLATVLNKLWPVLCFDKSNHRTILTQHKGLARIIALLLPSDKELLKVVKSSLEDSTAVNFAHNFAPRFLLEALLRCAEPTDQQGLQENAEQQVTEVEDTVAVIDSAVRNLAMNTDSGKSALERPTFLGAYERSSLKVPTGTSMTHLHEFYNPFSAVAPTTPMLGSSSVPLMAQLNNPMMQHSLQNPIPTIQPTVETTNWDRVSLGVTSRSLLPIPKVTNGKPLIQQSLNNFLTPTQPAQAAPTSSDRMATWVSRAEVVTALEPYQQYGATAQEEFFQLYCPMIEYSKGEQFRTALTIFLITWACNENPPRADQLYKQRFAKNGMLIPSVIGFFHQFKQAEETMGNSGSLRRGLANPNLATTVFNPDEHLGLYVRAAQAGFEYYFPYTYKILVAMLDSEIYAASMNESDFNLVQGERSSRTRHLQKYLVEIKRLHQVLFGYSNPADDNNKIIKSYSMLSFHLITWNIAFARGDLRLLHQNFVERYALYNLVPLCATNLEHKTVVFQDALLFLNHKCIECYRPGGCNIWCRYCASVGSQDSRTAASSHKILPAQFTAAFTAARAAAKGRLTQASWAARQNPVVTLIDKAVSNSSSSHSQTALTRALANQQLITEHLPIHSDF